MQCCCKIFPELPTPNSLHMYCICKNFLLDEALSLTKAMIYMQLADIDTGLESHSLLTQFLQGDRQPPTQSSIIRHQ